jgi:hypothetical protein
MSTVRQIFLTVALIAAAFLFWLQLERMGLGRLPLSVVARARDVVVHSPLISGFVAVGVLSLLLWVWRGRS